LRWKSLPEALIERPSAEHEVDRIGDDGIAQAAVEILAALAELKHLAEHRDATATWTDGRMAEQRQRSAHRGGIGVIAFVDQQRVTVGQPQRLSRPAALRVLKVAEG